MRMLFYISLIFGRQLCPHCSNERANWSYAGCISCTNMSTDLRCSPTAHVARSMRALSMCPWVRVAPSGVVGDGAGMAVSNDDGSLVAQLRTASSNVALMFGCAPPKLVSLLIIGLVADVHRVVMRHGHGVPIYERPRG